MKSLNLLVITLAMTLSILLIFTTSCNKDDSGPQTGVVLDNCDDSNCNDKSCAQTLDIRDDVVCTIADDDDVDWYAYVVTENDVNNNSGIYSFNFINDTEALNIEVELFADGVAEAKVLTTGNGDGIYEGGLDLTGGITFKEEGTYYIKVSRASGDLGNGLYQIRIN